LRNANSAASNPFFPKSFRPNVVNELLSAEKLSLGGARREVTVFFADVRGFTTFTDEMQEQRGGICPRTAA
jgi:class 3 adenylate cyclase